MDLTGTRSTALLERRDRPGRAHRPSGYLAGRHHAGKCPPTVREHAEHLVFDGVACAQFGAQLPVPIRAWKGSRP
jgi:hypothetical protein